eukprot:NODE_1242_length_1650_cov_0.281754.p3 type:complete len:104 gc:universal NODE_1242_length_1650_cov_0.281754:1181-1492(+)
MLHENCIICDKASKYTCPKCKARYCSLDCFKKHKSISHLENAELKNEIDDELLKQLASRGTRFQSICKNIMESEDPLIAVYREAKKNEDFANYVKELTTAFEK